MTVDVIIPAYNEEESIIRVLEDIPKDLVREVIVVDNNSTDKTGDNARNAGGTVVSQPSRGYGNACLKGMEYIGTKGSPPDTVVFIDGDYSDYPEEMEFLLNPIKKGKAQMVIGSRALGKRERGAMTPQQLFGNWLATRMIRLLYGVKYTDLGPFRAIRYEALIDLDMKDTSYGWTVEMQAKAAKKGLLQTEVPVNYRKRIGKSKISGTLKGTILAGYKIITTIIKLS